MLIQEAPEMHDFPFGSAHILGGYQQSQQFDGLPRHLSQAGGIHRTPPAGLEQVVIGLRNREPQQFNLVVCRFQGILLKLWQGKRFPLCGEKLVLYL